MTDHLQHLGGQVDDAGGQALRSLLREVVAASGVERPDESTPEGLALSVTGALANAANAATGALAEVAAGAVGGGVSAAAVARAGGSIVSLGSAVVLCADAIERIAGETGDGPGFRPGSD